MNVLVYAEHASLLGGTEIRLVAHDAGLELAPHPVQATDLATITAQLERRQEALPLEIAVRIALAVARATTHIHEVMGSALHQLRLEQVAVTRDGRIVVSGIPVDPATSDNPVTADVYALGRILFSLLCGHRPGGWVMLPLSMLIAEEVPAELIQIVTRSTTGGYVSTRALGDDLAAWLARRERRVTCGVIGRFFQAHRLTDAAVRPMPSPILYLEASATEDVEPPMDALDPRGPPAPWLWAVTLGLLCGGLFSILAL